MRSPVNRHRIWQVAADGVLIAVAWLLAFQLRFDSFGSIPPFYERLVNWRTVLLVVAIKLVVFTLFGFYNRWWRYVSTRDMWGAAQGVTVASLAASLVVYFFPPADTARLPRGVAILDWLLLLALVAGSRLLARTIFERPGAASLVARGKEVVVVGAGDAGQLVIREMLKSRALGYTPIGVVDDDPRKKNLRLHGIRVLGTTEDLPHILRDNRPDELLIAIPAASGEVRQRVVEYARDAQVPVKTLPGLYELIAGDHNLAAQIRPVEVEDILGREPVEVDFAAISEYLRGQTVLVTGAGGSIGSELCRQAARAGAGRLILVDQAETALFEIERELVDDRGFPASVPVLADIGNRDKLRRVFERYQPQIVFHAAAYKHVSMMEANPLEAARNNVLATKIVAEVAIEFGAERFLLISTDKALIAQAVYGQSKAVCEWIVEAYGQREDISTRFVAVRFGNVLDSAGSVIQIFKRQIAKGGPVTVTHPDMTRYFMTTPEAVSLVVHAGAIGRGGEIFVLDMGEPVSILELARSMIRLSGKEPDREIPIEFVGVRAGEKMHEELWGEDEVVGETEHPKIQRARRAPVDGVWLEEELRVLEDLVEGGETLEVVSRLSTMVRSPRRVGVAAKKTRSLSERSYSFTEYVLGALTRVARCSTPSSSAPSKPSAGRSASLPGAGSGKTTTITHRVANQVASGAFRSDQILAVTFTDKAAGEMRGRLEELGVPGVRCSTFHAAALGQLKFFAAEPPRKILASKALPLRYIGNTLRRPYRFRPAADLATEIEWAKNRRIAPSDYLSSLGDHEPPIPKDLMLRVYREYERRKSDQGWIDFEDLIELAIRLFDADEGALNQVRDRYQAFTVDEYQDVNLLQQTLLDRWLGDRDELCAVGDDYQSIYAFTGASPEHLLAMPQRFPHATVIRLEENYRSTPEVLEFANRLVPRLGRRGEGAPGDAGGGAGARRALVRDRRPGSRFRRRADPGAAAKKACRTRRWRSSSGRTRARPTTRRR